MTSRYTPYGAFQPKPNLERCPAAVHEQGRGVGFYQCSRKRGKHPEGWCSTHDPENEKKRREESTKRYYEQQEKDKQKRIMWGLADATVEQLEAELKRRKK